MNAKIITLHDSVTLPWSDVCENIVLALSRGDSVYQGGYEVGPQQDEQQLKWNIKLYSSAAAPRTLYTLHDSYEAGKVFWALVKGELEVPKEHITALTDKEIVELDYYDNMKFWKERLDWWLDMLRARQKKQNEEAKI